MTPRTSHTPEPPIAATQWCVFGLIVLAWLLGIELVVSALLRAVASLLGMEL